MTKRRYLELGMSLHRKLLWPFRPKGKLLLVLGTMRSGSTLISHILTNNSEIQGFGESHLIYDQPSRLLDLRYWVLRYTHRYPSFRHYLFDKVLHNDYMPDLPAVLSQSHPKLVFLLRMPVPTERSMHKMISKLQPEQVGDVDTWDMLQTRYAELERLLAQVPPETPVAILSYEKLLQQPDQVLAKLTDFLGLSVPLSSSYEVPQWGKHWGLGDGSPKAQSGQIVPKEITLETGTEPAEVLERFTDLRSALQNRPGVVEL